MDRRTFLSTIGVATLATPFVAQAQPAAPPSGRLWRVGILFQADARGPNPYLEAILQGFRDLGYGEGQNLKIEVRYAGGDLTRLPLLAHELVRLPVDVIMTPAPGIERGRAKGLARRDPHKVFCHSGSSEPTSSRHRSARATHAPYAVTVQVTPADQSRTRASRQPTSRAEPSPRWCRGTSGSPSRSTCPAHAGCYGPLLVGWSGVLIDTVLR